MAIHISTDGSVTSKKPLMQTFSTEELAKILGTDEQHIKLLDMGIFIVAIDTSEHNELNSVASLYFRFPIYGNVLAFSSQELPVSSSIITDENCKYDPDTFEQSFLLSLKDSLTAVETALSHDIAPAIKKRSRKRKPKKLLYHFDPDDPAQGVKLSDEEVDFIKEFYHFSFDNLATAKKLLKLPLYETDEYTITFMPGKEEKTLANMMTYYAELEEYEKCAVIRDKISMLRKELQKINTNAVQE